MTFGLGGTTAPTAPDTGGNITAGAATDYWWAVAQRRVYIQNLAISPGTIYLKINGASASASDFDLAMPPDSFFESPDGLLYGSSAALAMSLFSAIALTQGTHFVIRGWA